MAAGLYATYYQYEKLVIKADSVKSDAAKLPYRELGNANGVLWQAQREADHLATMGEPAAVDLVHRLRAARVNSNRLTLASGNSPKGQKYVQSIVAKLKKQTPKREKDLAKLDDNIQKGQLDAADALAKSMGLDLLSKVYYLSNSARKPYVDKFLFLVSKLDSLLEKKRRQTYQQVGAKSLTANSEAINKFGSESKRVVSQLTANGKVEIDGQDASHAEAIHYLCDQWGAASSAMMRNLAIQWAFGRDQPSDANKNASKQATQVSQAAREAILDVVKAAANSTPEDKVEVVYGEILQALTFVERRAKGTNISSDCKAALEKLIAKNPVLQARADAYRLATTDVLKWREKFAELQADALRSKYPGTAGLLNGLVEVTDSIKPEVFGSTSTRKIKIAPKSIGQPANWTVFEAGVVLDTRRVSEGKSLRLFEGSKTAVVPFKGNHYSNVRVDMPIKNHINDLRRILFVSEDHPPLTIEAADAVSSAVWEDFEQVGGAISEVHLEGVVTRFASLPRVVYTINPLGSLPQIDDSIPAIEQTCWRFNIEPHWARHKYFTVVIPARVQVRLTSK